MKVCCLHTLKLADFIMRASSSPDQETRLHTSISVHMEGNMQIE